ncbi:MAG TPA: hypothetical protein VJA94_19125 [Candidatus Angelobacter sp.]
MLFVGIYFVAAAVLCAIWYWLSLRHNRRKAVRVLRWIEAALAGQGHVVGMRWIDPSRFKVPLRLTSGIFHRAWILVEFTPCEMPVNWVLSKLRHQQDLITFQADLDWPPAFSLDVNNFRWFARSSRKISLEGRQWTLEQPGPFVISTRMDWQKEITSAMTSLTGSANREFLNINFRRRSPHFSATMPLESIAPGSPTRTYMFESVRELAASSSASLS